MSALEDLERLAALRDSGALTSEEYEHEKRRLGIGQPEQDRLAAERAAQKRKRANGCLVLFVIIGIIVMLYLAQFISVSTDEGALAQNGHDAGNVTSASMLIDEYKQSQADEGRPAVTTPERPARYAESDFSAYEKRLIDQARDAWAEYRGGDGDRENAYDDHSVLLTKLLGRGICWGRGEQPQAMYDYHRCKPDSIQMQPPEPVDANES